MRRRVLGPALGLLAPMVWGTGLGAQTAQPPAAARLSSDSVAMGTAFELLVEVPVPPGSTVYFPDTLLAADGMVSLAPVGWTTEATPDGGARIALSYPLIAFDAGTVPVPGLDVLVGPAGPAPLGEPIPGGSTVGRWADAPPGAGGGVRRLRVPRRGVWVDPVFSDEDLGRPLVPRPSADVIGSSWHWPSVALAMLLSGAILVVAVSFAREWVARRAGPEPARMTPRRARNIALAELDALLVSNPSEHVDAHGLYAGASGVVRRYAARLETAWGPDLTSGELVARLVARGESGEFPGGAAAEDGPVDDGSTHDGTTPDGPAHDRLAAGKPEGGGPDAGGLAGAMTVAEGVKFGRRRPTVSDALRDVSSLRDWVASTETWAW